MDESDPAQGQLWIQLSRGSEWSSGAHTTSQRLWVAPEAASLVPRMGSPTPNRELTAVGLGPRLAGSAGGSWHSYQMSTRLSLRFPSCISSVEGSGHQPRGRAVTEATAEWGPWAPALPVR